MRQMLAVSNYIYKHFLIYALVLFKTEHKYKWSAEHMHPFENEFRYKTMFKKSLIVYKKGKWFFFQIV